METLYLPYLTELDKIETALERMEQTDSRAVVVAFGSLQQRYLRPPGSGSVVTVIDAFNPSRLCLYKNEVILDAWLDGKQLCADLGEHGRDLPRLDDVIELRTPSYAQIDTLSGALQWSMDHYNVEYGVLFPPTPPGLQDAVLVVTRHEAGKDQLALATKVCKCISCRNKTSSPPDQTGKTCQVCGGQLKCI